MRLISVGWQWLQLAVRRAHAVRFVAALVTTCALLASLAGCRPEAETHTGRAQGTPGETKAGGTKAGGTKAENEQTASSDKQRAIIGSWEGLGGPGVAEWIKFYPPERAAVRESEIIAPATGEATSVGVFEVLQSGQLARGTYRLEGGSLQIIYRFYDAGGAPQSGRLRQTFATQPGPSLLRLTGRSGEVFIYGRVGKAPTPTSEAPPGH
jgi:hypothetical protein